MEDNENYEKKIKQIKSIISSLERLSRGLSRGDQLDLRYKIINLHTDAFRYSEDFEVIGSEIARFNEGTVHQTTGPETKKAINDLMVNNEDFCALMREIEKQAVDCTLTDSGGRVQHQFFRGDYPNMEVEYEDYDAIINGHAVWTDFDSHYAHDSMEISSLSHLAKIEDDIRTRTFSVITDTVNNISVHALLDDYKKMLTIYEENLDEKEIEDLENQIDAGVEKIKEHHVSYLNTLRELLKFSNKLKMRLKDYVAFSKSESLSMDLNKFLHDNNIIEENEHTHGRWPRVVSGISLHRQSLLSIRDEAYNFIEKQITDITQLKKDIKLIITLHSTKEETTENLFNKRLKNLTESFRLLNNLKQNKYAYNIDSKLEQSALQEIKKAYKGFLSTYKLEDGFSLSKIPLLNLLKSDLDDDNTNIKENLVKLQGELEQKMQELQEDSNLTENNTKTKIIFESLDQLKSHVRNDLSISCYSEYNTRRQSDCKYLPAIPSQRFKDEWKGWDDLFGVKTKYTLDEKLKIALDHLEKPENHTIKQSDYVLINGHKVNIGTWFSSLKQKEAENTINEDQLNCLKEIRQKISELSQKNSKEVAND